MPHRPAQVWTGSAWDDVGDNRLTTHTHAGGANGVNIAQSSVTNLATDLANKSNNPKTVDTKTANYTLVLGDKDKIVQMNSTSNLTITVPTNASVAFPVGTIVHVANINTGTLTIAGASGATVNEAGGLTLARWESGTLYQRAANNWVFLKGGGLGAANFSNTSTGTYTDGGGVSWKYVTFNASGTLTVTKEGLGDVLCVAGGGGGSFGAANESGGGGGGAGGYFLRTILLPVGTYTVTVGAGGSGGTNSSNQASGNVSFLAPSLVAFGGGHGGGLGGAPSAVASGGSGGGANAFLPAAGSALVAGAGNNGGRSTSGSGGGGGGGAGAAGSPGTSGDVGGAGGAGVSSSITGSSVARGGGGGGGGYLQPGGTATAGGGAGGQTIPSNGSNGTANTGGGGGAATNTAGGSSSNTGGNGGSGVVIVRVKV